MTLASRPPAPTRTLRWATSRRHRAGSWSKSSHRIATSAFQRKPVNIGDSLLESASDIETVGILPRGIRSQVNSPSACPVGQVDGSLHEELPHPCSPSTTVYDNVLDPTSGASRRPEEDEGERSDDLFSAARHEKRCIRRRNNRLEVIGLHWLRRRRELRNQSMHRFCQLRIDDDNFLDSYVAHCSPSPRHVGARTVS